MRLRRNTITVNLRLQDLRSSHFKELGEKKVETLYNTANKQEREGKDNLNKVIKKMKIIPFDG